MKFILFLSLPLYAIDQWTKQMVLRFITHDNPHVLVPDFFRLVNVTNPGAVFGFLISDLIRLVNALCGSSINTGPTFDNKFFSVISFVALLIVLVLLLRPRAPDRWRDLSLALLLAGILGNLTDRLLYGHVIDFLLFDLHIPYAHPWPAFNVADSCISVAVVLFIIHSFWKQKPRVEQSPGRGD
jgi:signal peptidase II